jgi:hypothetical protein
VEQSWEARVGASEVVGFPSAELVEKGVMQENFIAEVQIMMF